MRLIGVIGPTSARTVDLVAARSVGNLLAEAGLAVLTGGGAGVSLEASRGAKERGGTTIALLPGEHPHDANEFVDIAIATGMGEMRNALIVRSARALVTVGASFGTLSEIGFALRIGRPIVGIGSYDISHGGEPIDFPLRTSPEDAVEWVLAAIA